MQFRNSARIATYANFLGSTIFRRLFNVGSVWLFSAILSLPEVWLNNTFEYEVFNNTQWKCGVNYYTKDFYTMELTFEYFIDWYSNVRLWWIFFLGVVTPFFVVLIFSFFINIRLTRAVNFILNVSEKNHSSASSSPNFADSYGTYSTMRSRLEQSSPGDDHYPESFCSARTNLSLVKAQNYYQQRRKDQPINSIENYNMVSSSFKPGKNVPHSPLLSVAMKHGTSLLSLNPSSYNISSIRTTTSGLPPHGHGRNFKRRNSRVARHTVDNAATERKLLVAVVSTASVFFMLLQVPVFLLQLLSRKSILFKELTKTFADASQYLNCLAFTIIPVVMMFSYPAYKDFLSKKICCLRQKSFKGYIADF